jgi:hypothetical protein
MAPEVPGTTNRGGDDAVVGRAGPDGSPAGQFDGDVQVTGTIKTTHAVAQGNISAVGNVNAGKDVNAGHFINTEHVLAQGNISAEGNVNAAGDLNAAGNLHVGTDSGLLPSGHVVAQGNITAVGNVNAERDINARGFVRTRHIAASGNISADGNLNAGDTVNTTHVIAEGNISALGNVNADGSVNVRGDVVLLGGDCAEEFDVAPGAADNVLPGTVVVLSDEGALRQSTAAYDKRVAGVVAGGGDYRPGIVLDSKRGGGIRRAVAVLGKVACNVDAAYGAIEVGDLLTTSETPGHAMKVTDSTRAFGSVIGKALGSLPAGRALVPILVALQ